MHVYERFDANVTQNNMELILDYILLKKQLQVNTSIIKIEQSRSRAGVQMIHFNQLITETRSSVICVKKKLSANITVYLLYCS